MSNQRKPRPKMQIGPLTSQDAKLVTPPSLMGGFTSTQFQSQQKELRVDEIHPSKNQPRRTFTEESLEQLTESVRTHGILQPLSVHLKDGHYQLIAGERRLRAARAAGLTEVPVRIFEGMSEPQIRQLAALENLQREDLNPVDETDAIVDILSTELQISRRALTARLERLKRVKLRDPELLHVESKDRQDIEQIERLFSGLSRNRWTSFVSNRLPVLRLPEIILEAVRSGQLEYTKAVSIRRAPPEAHQKLVDLAATASLPRLRDAVDEANMTIPDEPGYQQFNAIFTQTRMMMNRRHVERLSQDEKDYLLMLMEEVSGVLAGTVKAKKKLPKLISRF